MTKSTSNSPPQGLNWTVLENDAANGPTASEKREGSSDIKGLFDRNRRTSVTPLPVGENISLPPMPEKKARVNLIAGESDLSPGGESGKPYSPPPVAAFGGKADVSKDQKGSADESTGESTRGLFSMDAVPVSKEEKASQTDSKAVQPVVVAKGSKAKKTVVGIGPGQPPLPPIPPVVKDAERAKDVADSRSPKSVQKEPNRTSKPERDKPDVKEALTVEEEPNRTSKPERTKPVTPDALADTLFSEISTIPSVPSKPASIKESKGKPSEDQPTESLSYEPSIPPPEVEVSFIDRPPKIKTVRAIALSSGAVIVLVGGLVAAVTIGLNRFASKRSTITVVQERVERTDKEPTEARPQEESFNKVAAKPEVEKPKAEQVQPKQTAQPSEPPEQDAIRSQKDEPIEPPGEASHSESAQANTKKEPERAVDFRELLRQGKTQLRHGEFDQAEASFRAILNQDPDEHHAMEGLVNILMKRKQANEALPYCERMVKKRPHRARYRILYGDALAMVGNKQAAKQQYSEALRYSPDNKEAKRRLASSQ